MPVSPPPRVALVACLLWAACADEPKAPPPPADPPPAEKVIPEQIDPGTDLDARLTLYALPAPSEILALLDEHGDGEALRATLGDALPSYDGLAAWQAALATGAATADLLVVIRTAPPEDLSRRLQNVADGMKAAGADASVTDALGELNAAVSGSAADRDALVGRFDLFHADLVGQRGGSLGEEALALIAIGGWARAVNLVSSRALVAGTPPRGADLLKLQVVIEALRERLGNGADVQPVRDALDRILPISTASAETPSTEDLTLLRDATGDILTAAGIGGAR